jgi:DNA ligase-1
MLKMKLIADADCVIIGYKPGEGKYSGMLGSFYCQDTISKKKFYISGMNDSVRINYKVDHPLGTILVYTFNGLTADSVPRHPRYKGIRND